MGKSILQKLKRDKLINFLFINVIYEEPMCL